MIQNNAMLVELNIRTWAARRMDKGVSEEVAAQKQAVRKAGNYNKHLLAGSDKIEQVNKVAAAARQFHYKHTLAWSDNGARILPVVAFASYTEKMRGFEAEFEGVVEEFVTEYPNLIVLAERDLGVMFNVNDYPAPETIKSKFGFSVSVMPIPASGDFRVDVGAEEMEILKNAYESRMECKVREAMEDAWRRLHECLTHMSDRLGGEKNIFRDSMVENALEMCELLKGLNITGDEKMENLRLQLEDSLHGVDPQDLRTDKGFRLEMKHRVDELLGAFV